MKSSPIRRLTRTVLAALIVSATVLGVPGEARALSGWAAELTRAPYLSDLTATSVRITWATMTQNHGVVKYGPPGGCTASTVTSTPLGSPITVNGVTEYRNSVELTGLSSGTPYCYRVYTGDTVAVDLLGSNGSPRFSTMEPATGTTPFSFAVFGDWGDTTNSGVNDGSLNVNQSSLLAQVAASGARFALSTGDIAYTGGTQTNYGDLNQTGVNISSVFGTPYWAVPGQSVPIHAVTGNHGRNATFLNVWPQSTTVAASGGVYSMVSYPSINGTTAASYPTAYYAFSSGGARFYMLDAAWSDSNVGAATGGTCGSHCKMYEMDRDAHWTASSAEYQWLAADLASHPEAVKMAVFHFPLRSDDSGQPDDEYLKWKPGSTGSLEELLHDNGVKLVFNGHSHIYQRNVAPPEGVISYVSGGGGAQSTSIGSKGCATTNAYGIGWSYTKNKGNACGAGVVPTGDSKVYHFLKVTVNGSTVTVIPTDSLGSTFDVQTYDFGADGTPPSAPGSLTATQPATTKVQLTWTSASDNVGVRAYDVYRNGTYLATLTPDLLTYTDATAVAGTGYNYQVKARDLAGNTTDATVSVSGGGAADTTPPSTPTGLAGSSPSPTSVALTWNASTDNVAVAGYTVRRGGVDVAAVTTTSYTDPGLIPGTAYTYQVVARDTAGNLSAPSSSVTTTTQADTMPPTTPGTPAATSVTATQVSLSWAASTDNVGLVRYDVMRDGSIVGTASGTTFTDTTVAAATAYTYTILAYDAAGNFSSSGPLSVTTSAAGSLFFDSFESGGLASWTTVSGLGVGTALPHTGTYAARETSSGTATYAYKTLSASSTELWAQSWVYVLSRSTSVNLFGYRTGTSASIVNVYIDTNGRLSLRNNVAGVTTYGTTTIAAGAWHRVVLHALVNGTSSSLDVSLDGSQVSGLTLTGQNLGTTPIARLQLGETSTGRTYDVVLDDVTVSQSAL